MEKDPIEQIVQMLSQQAATSARFALKPEEVKETNICQHAIKDGFEVHVSVCVKKHVAY